jgi:hypothetical protein|tara:strand:+ start:2079 stop:2357 length:279 start_codon:yes stop_codon:yes gene_type:complete
MAEKSDGRFTKGNRRGGRPKGTPNKVTAEVRQLAQSLFDAAYWKKTKARLAANTIAPAVHARLLAYAYGEPKQELKHSGKVEIGRIVDELHP